MIYSNIQLSLPKDKRYEKVKVRNGDIYCYYRVRSFRNEKGLLKHERKCVGKIIKDSKDSFEYLLPNQNYYKLNNLPQPSGGILKAAGRKVLAKNSTTYADKSILSFGYSLACYSIAKDLGLYSLLTDIFEESLANKFMAVAAFFAAGCPYGLSNIEHFSSRNMLFTNEIITSQRLSELYHQVTPELRKQFFKGWIKRWISNDLVCYDVTSISNYSNTLSIVDWGYNRDHERLRQVNVGMFCTVNSKQPLFFVEYNGSINDFTNLPYVLKEAESVGITKISTLVVDGGFAVNETFKQAREHNLDLILGAPSDYIFNIRSRLLAWQRQKPTTSNQKVILRNGESIRYTEETFCSNDINCRLILFKSSFSAIDKGTSLTQSIQCMEAELNRRKNYSRKMHKEFEPFFDISACEGGGFSFSLKHDVLLEHLDLCGCFALFCTRQDLSCAEVLDIYRRKDCVEKAFASYKNDILNDRIRTKDIDSLRGKLFLSFLGLVLRQELNNRLRAYLSEKRLSLDSAINILIDTQCWLNQGHWVFKDSLTKKQKEIAQILNLPIGFLDTVKGNT